MKKFFVCSCVWLLCQACSKPAKDPFCILPGLTQMVKTQTQCADVWGYGANNEETIAKLRSYLSQKNIKAESVTFLPTGEEAVCLACTCSRGFVIQVWADDQYVDSLLKEGFTKK